MKKSDITDLIKDSPSPLTKREISRVLGIKGSQERTKIKKILRELERDGVLIKQAGGVYSLPQSLPHVTTLEVSDIDVDGDVFCRPTDWNAELQGDPPRIELMPDKKGHPAVKLNDRILARLTRVSPPPQPSPHRGEEVKQSETGGGSLYEARVIKRLDDPRGRVMGEIRIQSGGGGILQPADKKARYDFEVAQADLGGAQNGDLVVGEIQPSRGAKRKKARIIEVIGKRDDPKAISLISLNEMGMHETFLPKVLKETEGLEVPDLKGREDLRAIPLVTIDGADARDFDDAVYAENLDDGGFHLIVAIADVSHYVRPGSALDEEAQRRGNSTYFPDRVVPMLPEALSNDLCSLRPKENRACLAVHMWIDEGGKLLRYKFVRGIMRSHARLIYEQVQAAMDGQTDDLTGPLLEPVIKPLYEAYAVLDKARQDRGALDLDLPEKQIIIDDKGTMTGVRKRLRLDAHKLIEEFMVLANVAAASALEDKRNPKAFPCVYRVHDRPSQEKLDSARDFVESFDLSMPKGQVMQPKILNHILRAAAKLPYSHLISMMILRCQSQAVYSTQNIGHFGLALSKYAHFTSPIRRYADLLVHRSLINAYGLGKGGLSEGEIARLDEICEHISGTERTSMEAERNAVDRFTAAYLSQQIGAEFDGAIGGVTRFGLFVTLDESGADGLVPIRTLPHDFYIHDEQQHALIGRKSQIVFRLGARVRVRLKEADGLTGSTVLELVGHEKGADIPGMTLKRPQSGGRDGRSHNKGGYKKQRHRDTKNKGKRRGPKKVTTQKLS